MLTELIASLRANASRASKVLTPALSASGKYSGVPEDIAIYYKQPMMFLQMGDPTRADQVLNHIKSTYLREDGDFRPESKSEPKSSNPAYGEFYAYTNGWIVRAASILGRDDVSTPGLAYLTALQDKGTGGFYTHNPADHDGVTDVITTAHLGLALLEAGQREPAIKAGNYLCDTLTIQPKLDAGFYLRRDFSGECLVDFPCEAAPICLVSRAEPNQLYFMIAYPIAYLVELYKVTKDSKYLEAARGYADFALGCHESVFACEFSHKLAWALSLLYEYLPEEAYVMAIKQITDYFISIQGKEGLWFYDDPLKCYDQSAEVVCWFTSIADNLGRKKKFEEDSKSGLGSGRAFFDSAEADEKEREEGTVATVSGAPGNQ